MSRMTTNKGHRRYRSLAAMIATASVLALSACASGGAGDAGDGEAPNTELPEITINLGHVVSETEPTNIALESVAEAVSERTDGRLTIELFPNGQLGQNRDMQEQTLTGAAQIAQIDPGYAAELSGNTELNIMGGPFLFDTVEDVNTLLDSDLVAAWNDQLADESGVHMLTWKFYFGERHIIANDGYPEPTDLDGVKIRVPPNPSWIETFEALPTSPTVLEWSEVYTGLQQGVIDAAEAPLATMKASSLHEVGDTVTLTGHFKAITGWWTSVEFWDSLPAEYQKILTEEFAAGAEVMTEMTIGLEDELRAEFEDDLGVTLVEPDIEAYKAAAEPFYDAFPEWGDGLYEQVLDILNAR